MEKSVEYRLETQHLAFPGLQIGGCCVWFSTIGIARLCNSCVIRLSAETPGRKREQQMKLGSRILIHSHWKQVPEWDRPPIKTLLAMSSTLDFDGCFAQKESARGIG